MKTKMIKCAYCEKLCHPKGLKAHERMHVSNRTDVMNYPVPPMADDDEVETKDYTEISVIQEMLNEINSNIGNLQLQIEDLHSVRRFLEEKLK